MNHLLFLGSCLGVGAFSGFLGGLLGIGGGVVIVPALIVIFDLGMLFGPQEAPAVAVATSLGCIVFTSLSAAITQARAGKVDWLIARRWVLFLVAGSFIAGSFAADLPAGVFRALLGGFLLFVAAVMLTNWKPSSRHTAPGLMLSAAVGTGGGAIAGIAGIAGGNVIVPTLIYFNTPIHRATATSSALGVPIALFGVLGYITSGWSLPWGYDHPGDVYIDPRWMLGYLYLPAFLAIIPAAMLAAPIGVRTAHRVAQLSLRRAFGLLLILVAGRMLYSVF